MMDWKGKKYFIRYFRPLIQVLQELGGSGTVSEVVDRMVEKLNIPESEQAKTLKNGSSYIANQIAWARHYLVKGGFIDSSQRGIWSLTEKGFDTDMTDDMALQLFKDCKEVQKREKEQKKLQKNLQDDSSEGESDIDVHEIEQQINYKTALLQILQSLHPAGFERLCQRLLRESGFQQVYVTGKTGDGGIDGHGILEINPLVSFNVLFQCKRYQGTVSASQLRDFRGAMMGRTDKGIFITTGRFTSDAKHEARREGVPSIELVDGDKLVEMFEKLELGLTPKRTFEVNERFFEEFR